MIRTVLSDGILTTRRIGARVVCEFETKPINSMDLKTTRAEAVARSKKDRKATYFLNVDSDGECTVVTEFDKDESLAAYKNGSEIALPEQTNVSEPTNQITMAKAKSATKKETVKPAKKNGAPIIYRATRIAMTAEQWKKFDAKKDVKLQSLATELVIGSL